MEVMTYIELTPKQMAEQFWEMDSKAQCKFFEELGNVIGEKTHWAQIQWFYLEEELRKNNLARITAMDIAAPLFWQTLKYIEKE